MSMDLHQWREAACGASTVRDYTVRTAMCSSIRVPVASFIIALPLHHLAAAILIMKTAAITFTGASSTDVSHPRPCFLDQSFSHLVPIQVRRPPRTFIFPHLTTLVESLSAAPSVGACVAAVCGAG